MVLGCLGASESFDTRRHLFALLVEHFRARVHERVRPVRGCYQIHALQGAGSKNAVPETGRVLEGSYSLVVKERLWSGCALGHVVGIVDLAVEP